MRRLTRRPGAQLFQVERVPSAFVLSAAGQLLGAVTDVGDAFYAQLAQALPRKPDSASTPPSTGPCAATGTGPHADTRAAEPSAGSQYVARRRFEDNEAHRESPGRSDQHPPQSAQREFEDASRQRLAKGSCYQHRVSVDGRLTDAAAGLHGAEMRSARAEERSDREAIRRRIAEDRAEVRRRAVDAAAAAEAVPAAAASGSSQTPTTLAVPDTVPKARIQFRRLDEHRVVSSEFDPATPFSTIRAFVQQVRSATALVADRSAHGLRRASPATLLRPARRRWRSAIHDPDELSASRLRTRR